MTPSINRMIKLLSDDERNFVDKQKVIYLEGEIIKAFNFDFNFISPLAFLERFLRLAEQFNDKPHYQLSVELLKVVCSSIRFLDHKASHIAAATYVMA
jgi:hypothetical protein